jgi:hypothetical protein
MNIISLIIQVISGAVGGNVAGAAMKESSLGTLGNSIAGIVGGGVGWDDPPNGNGNRGGRAAAVSTCRASSLTWPAAARVEPSLWPSSASSKIRWPKSSGAYASRAPISN